MAAYLVGQLTVTDPELMGKYVEKAGPMVERWGGEFLMRGVVHKVAEGDHPHQMGVVIRFPDLDTLDRWYESDEYKEIIGMRHNATEGTINFRFAHPVIRPGIAGRKPGLVAQGDAPSDFRQSASPKT